MCKVLTRGQDKLREADLTSTVPIALPTRTTIANTRATSQLNLSNNAAYPNSQFERDQTGNPIVALNLPSNLFLS